MTINQTTYIHFKKHNWHSLCTTLCEKINGSQGEDEDDNANILISLVLLKASWNNLEEIRINAIDYIVENCPLLSSLDQAVEGFDVTLYYEEVKVDDSEDALARFLGDPYEDQVVPDTITSSEEDAILKLPSPPQELPALALVIIDRSKKQLGWEYLPIKPAELKFFARQKNQSPNLIRSSSIFKMILQTIDMYSDLKDWPIRQEEAVQTKIYSDQLRIFVAGDRSSVGKSSVCLGLLSALMQQAKYLPHELGYIKPATQSEKPQLVEQYCNKHNIRNVSVGPLVYYRGFTRAFLAGETEDSDTLLQQCARAVDRVARDKKVVIIDGVGFPAVGSICGTDNAQVALACSNQYSKMGVVIVGGPGVGAAVDAYNLNAAYFKQANVPVLGPIFNKLPEDDNFYSLEQCKEQVSKYFALHADGPQPFGFVPLVDQLSTMTDAYQFAASFNKHVDINQILQAVKNIGSAAISQENTNNNLVTPAPQRQQVAGSARAKRSREEIEQAEDGSGAKKAAASKKQQRSANTTRAKRSREEIERAAITRGAKKSA